MSKENILKFNELMQQNPDGARELSREELDNVNGGYLIPWLVKKLVDFFVEKKVEEASGQTREDDSTVQYTAGFRCRRGRTE